MPPCAVEKGSIEPLLQLTCLGLLPAMTGISDDVTLSFFAVCIMLLVGMLCVLGKCLWDSCLF